jgi:hypothetical protein
MGIIALGVAAAAIAQNEATRPKPTPKDAPAGEQNPAGYVFSPADQLLASWLIVDNQGEIEFAEFGKERARDKDVKEFASRILEDHGRLASKLARFGSPAVQRDSSARRRANPPPQRDVTARDRTDAEKGVKQPAPRAPEQDAARPETRTAARPVQPEAQLDVIALKQDLGEKCVQTALRTEAW